MLTITPALLSVTANPKTKVYGATDPVLTDTLTGLVDTAVDGVTIDDTAATAVTGNLARAAGEAVAGSPYAITQGTLAAGSNYTIHFTTSTVTIAPATLTVVARPETKVFGSTDPAYGLYRPWLRVLGHRRDGSHRLVGAGGRRDRPGRSLRDQPGNSRGQQQLHDPLHRQFAEHHPSHAHCDRQCPGGNVYRRAHFGHSHRDWRHRHGGREPGGRCSDVDLLRRIGDFEHGPGRGSSLGLRDLYSGGQLPRQCRLCSEPVCARELRDRTRDHPEHRQDRTDVLREHVCLRKPRPSPSSQWSARPPLQPAAWSRSSTALIGWATVILNGSDRATLSVANVAPGSDAITATYNGAAGIPGASSSATTESVQQAATAIVLAPHAVLKGKKTLKAIALTAELEPVAPGRGVLTGQVMFELVTKHHKKTQVTTLGRAAAIGGAVTMGFKPTTVLNKMVTVVYGGDPDFAASSMTTPRLTNSGIANLPSSRGKTA